MAQIVFDGVNKTYEGGHVAVRSLDLEVREGEFMILVGPSGCGKTTALRMIAGLEDITGGRLLINGGIANDLPPRQRNIAMVFQSYALYPHLTVAENIGFGLRVRNLPGAHIQKKVNEVAELLELTALMNRKPAKLSGGQRQRVAMGRALVRSPNAFLMDEPLSNLDARLRGQMRAEIAKLQRMTSVTTVYVTHDQVEAMTMGDRVAIMNQGALQQLDTPRRLYDHPKNLFVASFIGSPPINFFSGELFVHEGTPSVRLGDFVLSVDAHSPLPTSGKVIVGIRPSALRLAAHAKAVGTVSASVAFVEDLGANLLVHLDAMGANMVSSGIVENDEDMRAVRPRLRAMIDGGAPARPGELLHFSVESSAIHVFDAGSGDAI